MRKLTEKFAMELYEALEVYVYEVVSRDYQQVIVDVEVVHAIAKRVSTAQVLI